MSYITSEDIKEALSVSCLQTFESTGVSIDSRTIEEGMVFIAIDGEFVDGHDYIEQALEKGAYAAIVSKDIKGVDEEKLIKVQDTFDALWELAYFMRQKSTGKWIGITGSVGKTTTKELALLMCQCHGQAEATKGNLNNHYGVPLTILNMQKNNQFNVVEMGMNHGGEISKLSALVRPEISIITNVSDVHREHFDSTESIARAKAEIMDGMISDQTIILNRDNAYYALLEEVALSKSLNICRFGKDHSSDIHFTSKSIEVYGKNYDWPMDIYGEHIRYNAASVVALSHALGVDISASIEAMAAYQLPLGRGAVLKTAQYVIIDDTYNASPVSVEAAIRTLSRHHNSSSRKVVVLGDMLELGEKSQALHEGLQQVIVEESVDLVCTVGKHMQHLFAQLPAKIQGAHFDNAKDAANAITNYLQKGDIILVKGSRGIRMETITEHLKGQ